MTGKFRAAWTRRLLLAGLCILGPALTSCGGESFAARYRAAHPDWEAQPPRLGAGLAETVAAQSGFEGEDFRVSPGALRLLRLDTEPWEEVEPTALLAPHFQASPEMRHALIVERICQARRGLRSLRERRGSWFLFHGASLAAFEDYGFQAGCGVESRFLPSAPGAEADLSAERAVLRFVAQRFPENRPSLAEGLRRGSILLERGRPRDAEASLREADRGLAALRLRAREAEDEEAARLRREEEEARALRAELSTALEEQRIRELDAEEGDAEERFWHGY